MDLHVCIKIDDDAVDKIARVITETVRKVSEIQLAGAAQNNATLRGQSGERIPDAQQVTLFNGQPVGETQIPPVQQPAGSVPQPAPTPQIPAQQPVAPAQQTVPTAAKTYTLDELASAAMLLMDRGMQVQLQNLLAGYGVEALPMLPPEQYGNFATALRGMGAQI